MLGMIAGPAAIELATATDRQLRDIGGFTQAINVSRLGSVRHSGAAGAGRCRLRPRVGGSAEADGCRRVGGGSSVVVGGLVER
jgi:hypothetical protein